MSENRIPTQIDRIATRRFLGCMLRFAVVFVLGLVAFALLVKHSHDRGARAAAAFAFGGLVFGFTASMLTSQSRKLLAGAFVLLPLVVALVLFAFRTLFGMSDALPLGLVLAPLALSAGFLIGQARRSD